MFELPDTKRIRRNELYAPDHIPSPKASVSRSPSPETLNRLRSHYYSLYEPVPVPDTTSIAADGAPRASPKSQNVPPGDLRVVANNGNDDDDDDEKGNGRKETATDHEHEYEFRLFANPTKGTHGAASIPTTQRPDQAGKPPDCVDLARSSNEPPAPTTPCQSPAARRPATRIRIRSDSPQPLASLSASDRRRRRSVGGFLPPAHRPLSYYCSEPAHFGGDGGRSSIGEKVRLLEKKAQMDAAAVSGEVLREWAEKRQPGCELPWRVKKIVINPTATAPTTMAKMRVRESKGGRATRAAAVVVGEEGGEGEGGLKSGKRRAGKKRRLVLRKRLQARREAEERMKGAVHARAEEEREKRTKRNREKKVKRIAREKAKRAATNAEEGGIDVGMKS